MNAKARRRALAEAVNGRGSVPVNELATELGCSEMTIRRDLDLLERDGVVRRVHGSALAASLRADEKPYAVRAFDASEAKERIGLAVAALIADELFDYLDAPVKRVAAMDTFVAYQPILEDAILPQPEDLFRAIAELAKY